MFQLLQKYISISLIAILLFFTNSSFLHAFSSLHENDNEPNIVEHSHDGRVEIHMANVLEPTENTHCISFQIDTLPHSLSGKVISEGKNICPTIDFIALAQLE